MLSYQHLYHAGNLADVHKHMALSWVLEYLTQKPKPLSYIETHAGRGLYDLTAPEALRTGEAEAGIARVCGALPEGHPYARVLSQVRQDHGPAAYPGSPMIAALLLRHIDSLTVAELHPREHAALVAAVEPLGVRIRQEDGFAMAKAICPPEPRRGLMLIDPSYEVKDEYDAIPKHLAAITRRWNVGVIILWYPLLTSGAHRTMLAALERAYPDALRHEVSFGAVREGHRMTGSGLFVINPPWGLEAALAKVREVFRDVAS
jgi:23S rRNA (adenine2030-N6)-methyltransferase